MLLSTRRAVVTALLTVFAGAVVLTARSAAGHFPPNGALDPQPTSRKFSFTYIAKVPAAPDAKEKLRLWIPVPQSNAYQDISAVQIDGPVKHATKRDGFYRNEFAYFDVPAADVQKGFVVTMKFDAVRREHRVALDAPSPNADPPTAAELKHYLEPDKLVPLDGVIGEMSAEQTKGLTDPLAKARAIYAYVVATMKYDKTGTGWGQGDAAWFCTAKRGNCTDFHGMFIGMARAAGIPARFEIGFPLPAKTGEGAIGGYHCWAEFYVKGYGWIPVDASEAWKNPEKRDYFFGAHDVNRVQFTVGRDLELAPKQAGAPVNYSVYPYAELDGKPFAGIKTEFAFKDMQ
jgi:transglutaminase-like putative cysteine protease